MRSSGVAGPLLMGKGRFPDPDMVVHKSILLKGRSYYLSLLDKVPSHDIPCVVSSVFFEMQRFSKECCSNFCRESISPVFCWCAKPREATSEGTYKSGKIFFAKALRVGYQTE